MQLAKTTKKTTFILPVQFTPEELNERRDEIASAMLEYDRVEAQKKIAAKEYAAVLKTLRTDMSRLARQINRGGEERDVECTLTFHDPEPGFKTITRLDTGEVVRQEPMTDDEKQENLFDDRDDVEFLKTLYERPSGENAVEGNREDALPPHERRGESPGAVPLPPPKPEAGIEGEAQA
jgi:hypothetical protein